MNEIRTWIIILVAVVFILPILLAVLVGGIKMAMEIWAEVFYQVRRLFKGDRS